MKVKFWNSNKDRMETYEIATEEELDEVLEVWRKENGKIQQGK